MGGDRHRLAHRTDRKPMYILDVSTKYICAKRKKIDKQRFIPTINHSMFKKSTSYLLFVSVLLLASQCSSLDRKNKNEFSYQKVEEEVYGQGMGGVIPLTMESGEAYGGWITPDNRYLVFTTNRNGNFDIYVRALNDVDVFPITTLASNQIEPALSPNGKKVAYIDDELDPDGDLVVQSFNPKASYENQKRGRKFSFQKLKDFFFKSRKILTNDEKNRVRSIERNPAWSPDSKQVVFSSDMTSLQGSPFGPGVGATQNLWLMEIKKPDEARRLTTKGGVMPSFSPDGKKIIYVSYQIANHGGDIFELEIESGEIHQLTNSPFLDLSPNYTADGKGIIFTRIDKDTNGDGNLDRKDNGIILYQNLQTQELVQLSYDNLNLFDTHLSNFSDGSILLSFAENETINVGYIPKGGIIPKQKSIAKQLVFAKEFTNTSWLKENAIDISAKKTNKAYLMALDSIDVFYPNSSQYTVFTVLKDLQKLKYFEKNNFSKELQQLRSEILQKINQGENLYRIYFDLNYLHSKKKSWPNLEPLIDTKSSLNYLRKITSKPDLYLKFYSSANDKNIKLNKKDITTLKNNSYSMVLPHLMDVYSQELLADKKDRAANVNDRRLLSSYPDYYRTGRMLFEKGQRKIEQPVPEEFLWLLYPKNYSQKEFLRYIDDQELLHDVRKQLYENFKPLALYSEDIKLKQIRDKYPVAKYPEIHYLSYLASATQAVKEQDGLLALQFLEKAKASVPQGGYWAFVSQLQKGKALSLEKKETQAISAYAKAIELYRSSYAYPEINYIVENVTKYYNSLAKDYLSKSDFDNTWKQYQSLLQVYQWLHNNKIEIKNLSANAVAAYMKVDELAFLSYETHPELMQKIEKFYADNIDKAHQTLNHPFIFGRGYLYTQLGIYLHRKYDKQPTGIQRFQKRKILGYFKTAQRDFEWSFMANPNFADSYIMLGWMYQYIDEKREQVIQPESGRKDKQVFSKLYANYFPRYLFEENIRIYQKSIATLQSKTSPQVLVNFHLNMANNYFLLNNYGKAEESYRFVYNHLSQGYRFENETQEALFFFNMGKTLFFTENYTESFERLTHAYKMYRQLAPLDTKQKSVNLQNQEKRELILKYMALASQYGLQYDNALSSYGEILKEKKAVQTTEKSALIYLEMARLNKELGDIYSKEEYYQTSLQQLDKADQALKQEAEVLAPRMPVRLRFIGISIPIASKKSYDTFFIGENRIAFEIPTLQRYQYLESVRADSFSGLGLLKQAETSLQNLQQHCQKDSSKHGTECLFSSYMRLGYTRYNMGKIEQARTTYEKVADLARSKKNLNAEVKARKNLLAIAAYEIENKEQDIDEKIKTIEAEKQNLENFKNEYVQAKIREREAELKKKNKKLTLTQEERLSIEQKKIEEIYPLLLYQGVFDGYLSEILEQKNIQTRKQSYAEYVKAKEKNALSFFSAMQIFTGNIQYNDKTYNFLNSQTDRKKLLTLSLNQAKTYQNVSLINKAQSMYLAAADKADEFQAKVPYAIAWYGLLQTNYDFSKNTFMSDSLEESFSALTSSRLLSNKYPQVYKEVLSAYTHNALQEENYTQALLLQNQKRHFSAWNGIKSRFVLPENEIGKKIARYQQLELVERSLQEKIEVLRFQRQKTTTLEKYLKAVSTQREELHNRLLNDPQSKNISRVIFSDTFAKQDLRGIYTPFLYIAQTDNGYSFWYVYEGNVDYQYFPINKQNIFAEISSMRNNPNYHQGKLPQWITWLKEKNPALIFADHQFWNFPFDKLLQHNIFYASTLESALMYQDNFALSRERWLQAGHSSAAPANSLAKNNFIKTVKTREELQENSLWSDALDYQAKLSAAGNLRNETEPPLTDILYSNYKPSLAIVSLQKDQYTNEEDVFHYAGGADLLLSAQGVSTTIFSPNTREKSANAIRKVLADYQPQISENLKVGGNLILSYIWFTSQLDYQQRKEALHDIALQEFNVYYQKTNDFFKKQKYVDARNTMERATFSLAREAKTKNIYLKNTSADVPPIRYLNIEQFNMRNEILFALQDKKTAETEYNYKFKQLSPDVSSNKPIEKENIANEILANADDAGEQEKIETTKTVAEKNTQKTQQPSQENVVQITAQGKELLFAYSDRLLRYRFIDEGLQKVKPIAKSMNNSQWYLLTESFFLSQSDGSVRDLKSYDEEFASYIEKIDLPKNPEQKMDFFIARTKRPLQWMGVLYNNLYLSRYHNLSLALKPTANLEDLSSKAGWIYSWLNSYTNEMRPSYMLSKDSTWLNSLAKIDTEASGAKEKDSKELSSQETMLLAVENLHNNNIDAALQNFSVLSSSATEIMQYDAILLTLWEKIQKRDVMPDDLQKLITFAVRLSNTAAKKFSMGNQRKIFYAMFMNLPRLMQDPISLQNSLVPYKDSVFSSFNRSLYNRMLIFASGFQPQITATMSYQSSKLYQGDAQNSELLNNLQLFDLFVQNSDTESLNDLVKKQRTLNSYMNIYFTYLINTKNYDLSLQYYFLREKQNITTWKEKYPLVGLLSTYPYTEYFWKQQNNTTFFEPLGQKTFANLKGKESVYVFLPSNNKEIRSSLLSGASQSVFLEKIYQPSAAARRKKIIDWTTNSSGTNLIDLNELFFANLGTKKNLRSKSAIYLSSATQDQSSADIKILSPLLDADPVTHNDISTRWKIYFSGKAQNYNRYLIFLDVFLNKLKTQTSYAPVQAYLETQSELYARFPELKEKNTIWMYR